MDKTPNIIYKTRNEERKCFYIGYATKGLSVRRNNHKYNCFKRKLDYKFYNFLRKYGWDSFDWEVLAVYSTPEELPQAEIDWLIEQKKEFSDWECLNLTDGGDGNPSPSDETRKKISELNKGEKNYFFGKGYLQTNENNPMYGVHRFGKDNPWFGQKHTTESKQKISKNHIDVSGSNNLNFGNHEKHSIRMKKWWKDRKQLS